ncbi:MAG: Membrane-bound dehydrogenase domain protein, partial [Verrucomicrobiales bacterium]|nr:Membrane-bound dehydrogenase domain protein [Verrucomicrobiales bacterium]
MKLMNLGLMGRMFLLGSLAFSYPIHSVLAATAPLELKKGDHIAIVGGSLADRMQHDGWLETLITAKFPQEDLVFRNLSASADEVATWHRSDNFGSRDQWLTKVQADVIFAFYGFNESFAGVGAIEKFRGNLDKFLKDTKTKNYSGKSSPRIVLFSPIANEALKDPNQPDVRENNRNLKEYTAVMAEVAKANDVPFVDLFTASQLVYADAAKSGKPATINTFMMNESGDKALAPEIFRALFSESAPSGNLEKLRLAIVDKNEEWHHRYRTVDGYNVYGVRSKLLFPKAGKDSPKISNADVMQEEMTQRDVKTSNRDLRVWAVAKGGDLKVVDSNLPAVDKIES